MNLRKVLGSLAVAALLLLPFAGSLGCTPPSDAGNGSVSGGTTHTTSADSNTTNN